MIKNFFTGLLTILAVFFFTLLPLVLGIYICVVCVPLEVGFKAFFIAAGATLLIIVSLVLMTVFGYLINEQK